MSTAVLSERSRSVEPPAEALALCQDLQSPLVSAIIPCLNEARTIGICIDKVRAAFERLGIDGEVVVGDNGSTDGSQDIARDRGARVVHQPIRGYGAAITAAAQAARGRFLIMADADDSYDWYDVDPFVRELEAGADVVMGNRFAGGIEANAMPPLHRYFGNPVLSGLARSLYGIPIGDFHCGMRAFTKDAFKRMAARSPGMEFASEMVINADRAGLRIVEVPIKLYPDKRGRPPHLNSFRDGWRHLRLIIARAPNQIYLVPGLLLLVAGVLGLGALAGGPVTIGGQYFGIHFVALASMMTLVGLNAILLGVLAKVTIATSHPIVGERLVTRLRNGRPVEGLIFGGGGVGLAGLAIYVALTFRWLFIDQPMEESVHVVFLATTACVAGFAMILTGFVLKLLLDHLDETAPLKCVGPDDAANLV